MRNMILEGVSHFHGAHVTAFSLSGYENVAGFKEALTSAEGVPATFELASALLQHFCCVIKTPVLLWTPTLDRPILNRKSALPGIEAPPLLQEYHVAMLGGPGSFQFASLRPRPMLEATHPEDSAASAATWRSTSRRRPLPVKHPGAAAAAGSASIVNVAKKRLDAKISGSTLQQAAFVVDDNSSIEYSQYLCSQTKEFTMKPHSFNRKLKILAERRVVRSTPKTTRNMAHPSFATC